jgi:hypothetical protein
VRGRLPEMRTALSQAVQKFGQNLVGRNQADLSKRLASVDYLHAILVTWI